MYDGPVPKSDFMHGPDVLAAGGEDLHNYGFTPLPARTTCRRAMYDDFVEGAVQAFGQHVTVRPFALQRGRGEHIDDRASPYL